MLLESERDLAYDDPARAAEAPARSLSPASDQYMIEGTIVRNLDKVTDVQASLRFDQTDSLALLGLGADGVGPALRRQSRTQNWEGSTSLNGMLDDRSEEHTSELQSLMRISYAVFCLKKKKTIP